MGRLRVSAISYLNTAPLMWDFQHGEAGREFEVQYTLPSVCAEAMRAGAADIGIIPVAACATIPGLLVIPDVAIAAKGAVRSILLFAKRPLAEVRLVAADTSSRTSVALCELLFRKWWGGARQFVPHAPDLEAMLVQADAALLIGDAALTAARGEYQVYDLGAEWRKLTGRPFVFAFWAVRRKALAGANAEEVARVFQQSRDRGTRPESIAAIAAEWAPRLGLSGEFVHEYLTRNVDYSLDAENLAGLELFFREAAECGVLPKAPAVEFVGSSQFSVLGSQL